jgi:hypothetical protein
MNATRAALLGIASLSLALLSACSSGPHCGFMDHTVTSGGGGGWSYARTESITGAIGFDGASLSVDHTAGITTSSDGGGDLPSSLSADFGSIFADGAVDAAVPDVDIESLPQSLDADVLMGDPDGVHAVLSVWAPPSGSARVYRCSAPELSLVRMHDASGIARYACLTEDGAWTSPVVIAVTTRREIDASSAPALDVVKQGAILVSGDAVSLRLTYITTKEYVPAWSGPTECIADDGEVYAPQ